MSFNRFYLIGFFLILALSLLVLDPWFSPPDWGKTTVFRIILSVLIFLFLYRFLTGKKQPCFKLSDKAKTGLFLLLALLGIFFLATLFSLDTHHSLWDTPYRSGGFVNFAFYVILGILAFSVFKKQDWQKIWNFAFLIGVLVSILAILQWQGFFEDILIAYANRPPASMGNPIMLALYLLLLSFLALAFAVKEKRLFKKLVYLSALSLFVFVVLLTYSRAAYLGLATGLLWFVFFYPYSRRRLSLALRISFLLILISASLAVYHINTQPLPEFVQENRTLKGITSRLSLEKALQDPRISGWQVSWQALKDRPLLGYGPENFAVGFDRHYDPSLPKIEEGVGGAGRWWDRAHNFFLEVSVTAGIPVLIIYLLLIGTLFWQLQKLKRSKEDKEAPVAAQGIQAAFIGYLAANFFSFDAFSIYLVFFLTAGYSLFLINRSEPLLEYVLMPEKTEKKLRKKGLKKWRKHRKIIVPVLLILLIWFIWSFNIKPLQINKEINLAIYESENNYCDQALERMENVIPQKSILDGYLRIKYLEVINNCIQEKDITESYPLAKKAQEILEENVQIMPYFTRNWLWLGKYSNILLEHWQEDGAEKKAAIAFEKANILSPKRQEVLEGWAKTDLLTGQYQQAKEKAKECIELNKSFAGCWWLKALSHIYLEDLEKADQYMETAREKRYRVKSKEALLDLTKAYVEIANHSRLLETYPELIKLEPEEPQHYASLAFVYQALGMTEEAKKQALKIIELFPEHKAEAEEFLKQLP